MLVSGHPATPRQGGGGGGGGRRACLLSTAAAERRGVRRGTAGLAEPGLHRRENKPPARLCQAAWGGEGRGVRVGGVEL